MKIFKLLNPKKMMHDSKSRADDYQMIAFMGALVFVGFTLMCFIVWDYGWIAVRIQGLAVLAYVISVVSYNTKYGEEE